MFDPSINSKNSTNVRKSKTKFSFQRSKMLSNPNLLLIKRKRRIERELNKYRNVYDSCEEKEMILDLEPPILIPLKSRFKRIWEYYMLFTILYSAFVTPYVLCFELELFFITFMDVLIEISLKVTKLCLDNPKYQLACRINIIFLAWLHFENFKLKDEVKKTSKDVKKIAIGCL